MVLNKHFNNPPSKEPSMEDVRAFIDAARNNDEASVARYLAAFPGRIVNAQSLHGDNALLTAAIYNHSGIVALLLDHGAAINMTNDYGQTALMGSAVKGNRDVVRLLLDRGADTEIKNHMNTYTAAMWAETSGHYAIYREILAEPSRREQAKRKAERAEEARKEESRRREEETLAAVYGGLKEDMDIAPIRFKKKPPPAP